MVKIKVTIIYDNHICDIYNIYIFSLWEET